MKIALRLLAAVCFIALSGSALAESTPRRWVIQETLPSGQVEVRVIEDEGSGRQDVISQQIVFKKIMSSAEAARFEFAGNVAAPSPLAFQPGNPLWVASKPQWTAFDEADYSNWIATRVTTDFLSGTGLVADCADMGLLFRWVYARDHQLPIANTMAGSGRLFGHFSSSASWDALAQDPDWRKDERFKAALRYLFDNTYTRTVVADLYPTEVSPQYVQPGSMFMIIRPNSGHTQTIHAIGLTSGIATLWGNEPASAAIFSTPLLLEAEEKETFGRWRYVEQVASPDGPLWKLISSDEMPGYSANQFGQVFKDVDALSDWIDAQLGIHIPDSVRFTNLVSTFQENLFIRESVAAAGLAFCHVTTCDPSSQDYEDYSTFSRDVRLQSEQKQILALISKLGSTDPIVIKTLAQFPSDEVIPGSGLTYLALLEDPTALGRLNPDPRVPFAERWGVTGSALTPTVTLNGDAVALTELLYQRLFFVQQGASLCQDGCDHESDSIKAYDTAHLDGGIRSLIGLLFADGAREGVDPDALPKIRLSFARGQLSITSPACPEKGGVCTLDDAVFADGAQARLAHWSPDPWDAVGARWGF
jgi:hypothetical protein